MVEWRSIGRGWIFAMAFSSAAACHAAPLSFTKVADTADGYSNFLLPAANSSGTVAFIAVNGQKKVFSASSGGVITPLQTVAGVVSAPSINESGQIAYGTTGSINRLTGNQVTPIYTSLGQIPLWNTAIANDGTVYFSTMQQTNDVRYGKGSGGAITPILSQPGTLASPMLSRPAVSANGLGVVSERQFSQFTIGGIFRENGATIIDSGTTFDPPPFNFTYDRFGDVDINSAGNVVFTASFNANPSQGIYRLSNGVVTGLSPTSLTGSFVPGINDNGVVAALVGAPVESLKAGFGALTETVLSVGDPFMGSTVTDLDFQHDGLGEGNQLAFYAALADGRQGIYVTSVPEPAALAAMGLAVAPLLLRRRHDRA